MGPEYSSLDKAVEFSVNSLKVLGQLVDAGRWQGIPTEGKPDLKTREILDLHFGVNLDRALMRAATTAWVNQMAFETGCNQEWADEHFAERVGGKPLNPDPSHERWPWWQGQSEKTKDVLYGTFTHTYSERFWPKQAGDVVWDEGGSARHGADYGIRFSFGDYDDVLEMLAKDPYTRQAYLPIFFPEDTGAVHGGRIPCSLGYHFLLRNGRLHCWYDIRSCDAVRHFRDDLYLAARLVGHTLEQLASRTSLWSVVIPGTLHFTCHSFHYHLGDAHRLMTP